jgi:hypothetical protein
MALKRLRETTDISNPKETKTKENKIRKNTIFKNKRKSLLSYFKIKKKRGKINIGGNIIPENIEINFDKKNSIFLIGKEKTYSKTRFSRAELIDKLEGNSEKAGTKRNDIFTNEAKNFPTPENP